jgi:hypothetical protein
MAEGYGKVAVASLAGFFAALSVASLGTLDAGNLVPLVCFVAFVAGLDWLARRKALVKSALGSFFAGFVLAASIVPYLVH